MAAASIKLEPITDKTTYGAERDPQISMKITNTRHGRLHLNVGSTVQELTITSGTEQIWTSKDCQKTRWTPRPSSSRMRRSRRSRSRGTAPGQRPDLPGTRPHGHRRRSELPPDGARREASSRRTPRSSSSSELNSGTPHQLGRRQGERAFASAFLSWSSRASSRVVNPSRRASAIRCLAFDTGRISPARLISPTAASVPGQRAVLERAGHGERDRQVGAGLGEPDAADRRHVDIASAELAASAAARAPRAASPRGTRRPRSPPGAAAGRGRRHDERLHLDRQRAPALDRDGHAGAADRLPAVAEEQPARVGAPRRCRRRSSRSSPPRPSGRTGSCGPGRSAATVCRSPSNWQTTSTRCSSRRGPAIEPSLVTWPTSRIGRLRSLDDPDERGRRPRAPGDGPPASPSDSEDDTVCTESTMSSCGSTWSTWPRIVARSVSAAR